LLCGCGGCLRVDKEVSVTTVPTVPAGEIVEYGDTVLPYVVAFLGAAVTLITAWWVRTTRKTLTPNGDKSLDDGGSIFDAINRIEKAQEVTREEARLTRESTALLNRRLLRTEEKVDQLVAEITTSTPKKAAPRKQAPRKATS
jgi:hypothetical protein